MDKISALVDGELDEKEAGRQLSQIRQHEKLRERWDVFHLIGDTLRNDCRLSPHFSRRVADRLALEPTVLAPRRSAARRIATYALSAAASLSAVAVVAWIAFSDNPLNVPQEIAKLQAPAAVPPPQVAGNPNMNEYLLAHQGFSPSTALQGVVPYIRTVSDSHPLPNR